MTRAMRALPLFTVLVATSCASAPRAAPEFVPGSGPPPVAREFRGVWVATVSNIDWPSRRGLPVDSQKAELIAIMDRAVALKLNAVIFQVRTTGDALYASELEPWSEYITGVMGQAPDPFYDPLEFAVKAAHERGLELHAWLNPYRARHPSSTAALAKNHLAVTRPDIVRRYGTHLWMDPGERAVQDHTTAVVLDVVRRYDIDGLHFDDYFYPYRERDSANVEIPFPDEPSWQRYVAGGGKLSRSDWRRHNVDELIQRLYGEIHAVKPWVKFGVSPIGVWRPGYPAEGCCFDAYESIYADSRKWLAEGWLDYFVPQLYRTMSDSLMNYGVMLGWWSQQNEKQRQLYVGMIPSRVTGRAGGWPASEIVGQVYVARGHPGASGHVHFSAKALMQSPDSLSEKLARSVYRTPALVPLSAWMEGPAPPRPQVRLSPGSSTNRATLSMEPGNDTPVRVWVVRALYGNRWVVDVVPGTRTMIELSGPSALREVTVSAVDRNGKEGPMAVVQAPREN
jgi:uncharacterized lipoprotein YddW (UPF0748 family)